jgi:hypothetical protein
LWWSPDVDAGAWTQHKGGYYLKLSSGYLDASEDIDADGERVPKAGAGSLRDFSYSAYVEYGLRDDLTVVASFPYKRLHDERTFVSGITRESRTGFGDAEVRLRQSVLSAPLVVSVAAGGKIPLWNEDDPGTRVPLGSSHADGDFRLLVGKSLYPAPGYVTGEVGYRVRGGSLSNEVFYEFEAGATLKRFLIKGFVSGARTTGDCQPTGEVGLIGDQNVLKISPGLIYNATPGLELSLEVIHIAGGCNTTAGSTFLFGVAFKR